MNIVIIGDSFCEYIILQANALANQSHSVLVVLPESLVRRTIGNLTDDILKKGVKVCLCDEDRAWKIAYYRKAIREIYDFHPDLIHIHENGEMLTLAVSLIFLNLPLVLTVHDVRPHPGVDSRMKKRRRLIREFLRRRANAIHLHGKSLFQDFKKLYPTYKKKIYIIPHGSLTLFKKWNEKNIERKPFTCLFFGRMEKYRGLDNLFIVAEKLRKLLPQAKIVIAGTGTELEKFKKGFERLGNCEIHNRYIPDSEVPSLFKSACCVLLPYKEASQSGVLSMAITFGLPVVATDVGAIKETIQDNVHGRIIKENDMDGFAQAIVTILTDEQLSKKMSDECMKLSKKLSFEALFLKYVNMYLEICKSRK